MPKARTRFTDPEILAAAILRSRGALQASIAEALGVSPATVTRMLDEAEANKWFNPNPAVLFRNVPPGLVDEANAYLAPSELGEKLRLAMGSEHRCHVSIIRDKTTRAWNVGAAGAVVQQLIDAGVLGVSWGWAISGVVDGLERMVMSPPRADGRTPVRPIPVCGDPICAHKTRQEFSSTWLADCIDRVLNDDAAREAVPSLSAVFAYIPRAMAKPSSGVREFLANSPGYSELVGATPGGGLFAKVDTLLTGIGIPATSGPYSLGVFVRERAECEKIPEAEMSRLVFGDIAGVLIPRPNLSAADRKLVQSLNEGWTGLRLADIERCAREGRAKGRGGVIVVTQGKLKKDFILELLRLGLVNRLVVDGELADALSAHGRAAPAKSAGLASSGAAES